VTGATRSKAVERQIYWDRLLSLVQEEAAGIMRTAFSPIVSENGDLACSLFDSAGRMLVQSMMGPPGFSYSTAVGVPKMLAQFPAEDWAPGDIVVSNDPWLLTGHLHDVTLIGPIFSDEELIAFGSCTVHWPDVGGRVFSAAAREVFEEGLWIPPMKLSRAGAIDTALVGLVSANVRLPGAMSGDLEAQIGAIASMQRRVPELVREFPQIDLSALGDYIGVTTQDRVVKSIRVLPQGEFHGSVALDGFEHELVIENTINVADERIIVDFSGTSSQVEHGINCVYNFTRAYATFAIKCAVCPDVPTNFGMFPAIDVVAPEGCLLNPAFPAPVAARHIVAQFIPLAVFAALSEAIPDKVLAESGISGGAIVFDGWDEGGRRFVCTLLSAGGIGGSSEQDGASTLAFPTNWFNTPVEVVENTAPLLVRSRSLLPSSKGEGRHEGGAGQRQQFRVMGTSDVTLSCMFDHARVPPKGYFGGGDGGKVRVVINGAVWADTKSNVTLHPGDEVIIDTAGGGGFGPADDVR
jgi:N-methylhydantoinase B/oxoprolinase/acetone carboxylase alpha subunit